jgi:hypothetical protein
MWAVSGRHAQSAAVNDSSPGAQPAPGTDSGTCMCYVGQHELRHSLLCSPLQLRAQVQQQVRQEVE